MAVSNLVIQVRQKNQKAARNTTGILKFPSKRRDWDWIPRYYLFCILLRPLVLVWRLGAWQQRSPDPLNFCQSQGRWTKANINHPACLWEEEIFWRASKALSQINSTPQPDLVCVCSTAQSSPLPPDQLSSHLPSLPVPLCCALSFHSLILTDFCLPPHL